MKKLSFLETMRFRIPPQIIISFINSHFTGVKETSTGEIRVNTPFANDSKFHLYINPVKGVVKDFKTGYGSDFITFVSDFLDLNKREIIPYLIREFSVEGDSIAIENPVSSASQDLNIPTTGLHFFAIKREGLIRNIAYGYLKSRKIPEDNIEDLGYIFDENSEYHNTIFIPYYENGELVYFVTRDFTDKNPLRYNMPSGINSKQFVYNIEKMREGGNVFIFEGLLNALSLNKQVGTAMLSADLGKEQAIKILDTAPKNIIFVPDNDEAGEKSLAKNIKLLLRYKPPSLSLSVFTYRVSPYNDFNEMVKKTDNHIIDFNKCERWHDVIIDKKNFRRKELI